MKRVILVILMMISTVLVSSFRYAAGSEAPKTSYASYYHDKFNGKRTASGEIFDNKKFTAAHRTFPFGTKVKVTNLRNGESVVVTVNDRGPFHSSRALDLTKAAFDEIGDLGKGTMPIEYEPLDE